jgi:hypothetical protein
MPAVVHHVLVLVWFLAYTAAVYVLLHIVVLRFTADPQSRLRWFFGVLTGPLTRPVRALLPRDTPEARVRWATLGLLILIWLAARMLLARGGGVDLG